MGIRLSLILILPAMLFAFQNCGKAADPSSSIEGGGGDTKSQTIIGSTAAYKKITYDPLLELNRTSSHLEINIDTGSISVNTSGTLKSCTLDTNRLNQVREILQTSQICEPGPLPPGMVSCLAFGVADIELSNDTSGIQLRPVICNSGTFLCDGNDAKLRALILDLGTNPPVGCN